MWNKKAGRFNTQNFSLAWTCPCPKLCSTLYPWFFSTLLCSFSIFRHARPQSARCFAFSAVIYVRYPTVVERPLFLSFVPDAHLQPVYHKRLLFLFRIPDRRAVCLPAGVRQMMMPAVPFPLRPFPRIRVFHGLGKPLMRFVLAGKDKTVSDFPRLPAKRLVGIQIVSRQCRYRPRILLSMAVQLSFCRSKLTILLLFPVPVGYHLYHYRQHRRIPRLYYRPASATMKYLGVMSMRGM